MLVLERHTDNIYLFFFILKEPHVHDASSCVEKCDHSFSNMMDNVIICKRPIILFKLLFLIFLSSDTRVIFVNDFAAEIARGLVLNFLSFNRNPIICNLFKKSCRLFHQQLIFDKFVDLHTSFVDRFIVVLRQ